MASWLDECRPSLRGAGLNATPKAALGVRSFTADQIETIVRQAKEDGEARAFRHLLMLCAIVLRDEFGFGGIRLQRFIAGAVVRLGCLQRDEIDLAGEEEAIYEETGIRLRSRETLDGVVLTVDIAEDWHRPRPPSMQELLEKGLEV